MPARDGSRPESINASEVTPGAAARPRADAGARSIRRSTFIRASAEDVYELIATAEGLDRWFTTGASVEPHPGGRIVYRWKDWGAERVTTESRGTVHEAIPPRRFVFDWDAGAGQQVTVEFDIEPAQGGVVLRLFEHGYAETEAATEARVRQASGWGEAMTLIKVMAEASTATSPSFEMTHALGAASVIVDAAGRVLLVKHNYGRHNWEIPGGISEEGESAQETAMREAREELGVALVLEKLTGVYWEPAWRDRGGHHFVFLARLADGATPLPADPDEIADLRWSAADDLPRPISDFTVQRIRDALAGGFPLLRTIHSRSWIE